MSTRNIKEISNKTYQLVIGLFLCLLSVVLCLNAGYVGKALSFSFSYTIGMASYLFYVFLFIEGIFLIFKHRGMMIKPTPYFFGTLVLLVGALGLFTYLGVNQSSGYLSFADGENKLHLFGKLNDVFANVNYGDKVANYFQKDPVFLVFGENEFGCGLLGYLLVTIGNSAFASETGGLVFSIIIASVGLLIIVIPAIVTLVKNKKKAPVVAKNKGETNSHKRIKNINVIKGAKNIDPATYHSEVSGAGRNVEPVFEIESLEEATPKVEQIATSSSVGSNFYDNSIEDFSPEIESIDGFKEVDFELEGVSSSSGSSKVVESHPFTNKVEEKFTPAEETHTAERTFEEVFGAPIVEEPKVEASKEENIMISFEEPVAPTKVEVATPAPTPVVETPVFSNPAPVSEPLQVQKEEPKPEPVEDAPKKKARVNFKVIGSANLKTYDTSDVAELNARIAAERKEIINNTFQDFNVGAEVVDYTIGPSVTRFNIRTKPNVSVKSVSNLVQDISVRLNGVNARFETVVEGQSTSGLEIPNEEITMVPFKDVYEALPSNLQKHPLAVAFGKNIKGQVISADFNEFPHILVSGTTGSGKSVFVNSLICTLIMRNSPDDLKLILVDPKQVEMSRYADMPHLLCPIITEASKVKLVLDKLVEEMNYRYSLFSKNNATNIKEYNEDCEFNGNEKVPYIVAILDEYADLVDDCKEISLPVVSLSQKARACGIHLMLATQRPSTNVVTGVIKANMPTHVALMTSNYVDSMTIIGEGGAEKLLGKGDMLVQSPLVSRVGVVRLQSCYIDRREIVAIVSELKSNYPTDYDPKYMNLEEKKETEFTPGDGGPEEPSGNDEEAKYRSIKEWVMAQEYMSMSRIQRECAVGFNRAGRFFQRLQREGVVGTETEGNKGCKVLMQDKFGNEFDDSALPTSDDNSYIK